jgi:hypothetical protein
MQFDFARKKSKQLVNFSIINKFMLIYANFCVNFRVNLSKNISPFNGKGNVEYQSGFSVTKIIQKNLIWTEHPTGVAIRNKICYKI